MIYIYTHYIYICIIICIYIYRGKGLLCLCTRYACLHQTRVPHSVQNGSSVIFSMKITILRAMGHRWLFFKKKKREISVCTPPKMLEERKDSRTQRKQTKQTIRNSIIKKTKQTNNKKSQKKKNGFNEVSDAEQCHCPPREMAIH